MSMTFLQQIISSRLLQAGRMHIQPWGAMAPPKTFDTLLQYCIKINRAPTKCNDWPLQTFLQSIYIVNERGLVLTQARLLLTQFKSYHIKSEDNQAIHLLALHCQKLEFSKLWDTRQSLVLEFNQLWMFIILFLDNENL